MRKFRKLLCIVLILELILVHFPTVIFADGDTVEPWCEGAWISQSLVSP